jgi:tryptophan-rich sensory protein
MDPLENILLLKSYVQNPKVSGFGWAFPPTHAELSVAFFFRSVLVLQTSWLEDFNMWDQFQALQTQVIEGFQSMDFLLQEQEAEVAQIQINVRNTLCHLMPEDQWDLEP